MALVNSILGIDIGGTKISMGIVSNGKVVQSIILKTPANEAKEKIVQFIIKGIESLPGYNDIVGIGIGSPGLVDEEQGIIFSVQNIPSWNEVPLKQYLSNYFNKPVFITNDANCFAIGVKTFGEGKPYSNLLGLSIGTGLGAGIIMEGGLYSGVNSSAGEVGGLPYLDADYETYCSGKFFKKMYNISGEEASELAEQKNSKCLAMFEEFGIHVGNLIKTILFIMAPEAIIIGGSVSNSFLFWEEAMLKTIKTFPYAKTIENLVVEKSDVENIAVKGAAALFINRYNKG